MSTVEVLYVYMRAFTEPAHLPFFLVNVLVQYMVLVQYLYTTNRGVPCLRQFETFTV